MNETIHIQAGARTHKAGCMGNHDYRDCTCGSSRLVMPALGEAQEAKREVVKLTMPAMTIDTED